MVAQKRGLLLPRLGRALEPVGEGGVQLRSPGLRQRAVGDLAREGVLDHELPLALQRRAGPSPDEVAVLQQYVVRLLAAEQLTDRPRPERPPDHGRRLQGRLLRRRQEVDPSGEHRLNRVGDLEALRELARRPAAVRTLQHAMIDERRDELLDEEGVSAGALDESASHGLRQL